MTVVIGTVVKAADGDVRLYPVVPGDGDANKHSYLYRPSTGECWSIHTRDDATGKTVTWEKLSVEEAKVISQKPWYADVVGGGTWQPYEDGRKSVAITFDAATARYSTCPAWEAERPVEVVVAGSYEEACNEAQAKARALQDSLTWGVVRSQLSGEVTVKPAPSIRNLPYQEVISAGMTREDASLKLHEIELLDKGVDLGSFTVAISYFNEGDIQILHPMEVNWKHKVLTEGLTLEQAMSFVEALS